EPRTKPGTRNSLFRRKESTSCPCHSSCLETGRSGSPLRRVARQCCSVPTDLNYEGASSSDLGGAGQGFLSSALSALPDGCSGLGCHRMRSELPRQGRSAALPGIHPLQVELRVASGGSVAERCRASGGEFPGSLRSVERPLHNLRDLQRQ